LTGSVPVHPRGRLRLALFVLAALAVAAPLIAGFLGALHPALDSFAHFRAHLAVAAGLLAVSGLLAVGRRGRGVALALIVPAVAAGWTVAPFLVSGAGVEGLGGRIACAANGAVCPAGADRAEAGGAADGRTLTLLQMNLLRPADPSAAIAAIVRHAPDLVTLQEMQEGFPEALAAAGGDYPHVAVCPPHDQRIAILSRRPFVPDEGACVGEHGFLSRTVAVSGRHVAVVSQHLRWPWPFSQWYHLDGLADDLSALAAPVVVGGDFNAVPWSAAVATFARLSGTMPVAGIGATWLHPTFPDGWRPLVGLPIDHVLVSPAVGIVSVTRLPATASDHLPVLVRLRP